MFHASIPQHSKDVIMGSLQDYHDTVRVVFQAVLKTISKLVVEEGKVEIQLTP